MNSSYNDASPGGHAYPRGDASQPGVRGAEWVNRGIAALVVLTGVGLAVWVVIRNEPFKDPYSPQIIRVCLGLIAGWGVYSLPGHLGFSYQAADQLHFERPSRSRGTDPAGVPTASG